MPESDMYSSRKYLYAVVSDTGDRPYRAFGINGNPIFSISNGRVAAVVSDILDETIRPERRHLAAHQGILKRLMEETTVLPMSFGIIADSPTAIRTILSRNQDALVGQLHHVEGKVEMGVRVTWDVANIYEFFVNTHPELRVARDRLLGSQRKPKQEDTIEVGRLFERMLNADRDAHTGKVQKILAPICHEIKRNRCQKETEVVNLSCLVGREGQAEFEAGILKAAKLFDKNFAFAYSGPWAPHNFIALNLKFLVEKPRGENAAV